MGAQSQAVQTSGWIPGGWGGQGEVHKTIALNWALGKWREVGVCMCVGGGGGSCPQAGPDGRAGTHFDTCSVSR